MIWRPRAIPEGDALNNIVCKLPVEIIQGVLFGYLNVADIVRFDTAGLVHKHRQQFQSLYQGGFY